MPLSRRRFLFAGTALATLPVARPAEAAPRRTRAPATFLLDDASRLNLTPIARYAVIGAGDEARLLRDLRATLREALTGGRPVAAGGARHSMGGQSLPRHGIAASLAATSVEPDTARKTYHVSAGARWRDVIRALDPIGFSPAVTQSNHDFSIGGTLSVNAHGWPVPFGPFGSTVNRFRIMLADGTVLTCSPVENTELFKLAIGGYGLFGIVIDAELQMEPNVLLRPRAQRLAADAFAQPFTAFAADDQVRMRYGRLSVARDNFLRDALLVDYRPAPEQPQLLPPSRHSAIYSYASRELFRAQTGSERGKKARWLAETRLMPRLGSIGVTRNTLLDSPVAALAARDSARTDILHEYFLPPEHFADFLAACRRIVPAHRQDLLNVTLRYVGADPVSVLAYAREPRIAAVMLFVQSRTAEAEAGMRAMTELLIDAVLKLGGSYYLPYRLHARPEQFRKAYPALHEFVAAKRRYDPQLRFRNALWDRYMA
jgi:FAD/FMN-containing dehydrogenase